MSAIPETPCSTSSPMIVDYKEDKPELVTWIIKVIQRSGPNKGMVRGITAIKTINQLAGILAEYAHWMDPLSKGLYKWGVHVILAFNELKRNAAFLTQPVNIDLTELTTLAVNKLFKKVLVHPLIPDAFLKEPVVEGALFDTVDPKTQAKLKVPRLVSGRLWEKSMLTYYSSLCDRSPYDEKPLDGATPHLFAERIIKWIKERG